jgi:glutathione synthase/RimK-type ligase-like ATP-grasp enzyme
LLDATAALKSGPFVILTNPVSSGVYLARALHEAGAHTVHVYDRVLADVLLSDTLASYTLLNTSPEDTARAVRPLRPISVVPGAQGGTQLADILGALLGLPHNDPSLSLARCDKGRMFERLSAAGVAAPKFAVVHDEAEIGAAVSRAGGLPVVVKPTNSAGGDQVHYCTSIADAIVAFRAINLGRNVLGNINFGALVGEYLDGPQAQVSTVTIEGQHLVTEYYEERYDVLGDRTLGRYVRTKSLANDDHAAISYALKCLDAIGLREGPANVEVRLTARGPRLLEVNPRLMGPVLDADPYHAAFGYAPQHLVAERCLRPGVFRERLRSDYGPRKMFGMYHLRCRRRGRVVQLRNIGRIRELPGFFGLYRLPDLGQWISDPLETVASSPTVYFVSADEAAIAYSLEVLCDMEDAGEFFEIDEAETTSAHRPCVLSGTARPVKRCRRRAG